MKNYDLAEEAWLEATRLKPSDLTSSRQLILLYEEQAMPDKYSKLLTRLAADTKAPPDILIRLADLKLSAGDMLSATQILRRALKVGLDPALVCDRQSRFPELSIVNCQDD
jgi:hypothetical protein